MKKFLIALNLVIWSFVGHQVVYAAETKKACVMQKDQKTGKLTRGYVRWILTSAPYHSRGIKVMIENRQVGRVQYIGWNGEMDLNPDRID